MKKLIAMLLILVLGMSILACGAEPAPTEAATAAANGAAPTAANGAATTTGSEGLTFTVTVIHKDQTEKTFTYTSTEEFVGTVLKAEGLIKGNDGPYGLEITKVEGVQAIYTQDKAYWAVYEGEEYALQGIDTTPAVDGGVYKLVYTLG